MFDFLCVCFAMVCSVSVRVLCFSFVFLFCCFFSDCLCVDLFVCVIHFCLFSDCFPEYVECLVLWGESDLFFCLLIIVYYVQLSLF